MLKTNSREARANVRSFIKEAFDFEGYEPISISSRYDSFYGGVDGSNGNFNEIAYCIWSTFWNEVGKHDCYRNSTANSFERWCQGLPTVLDTATYYLGSAIDLLGDILEESEEERSKYDEFDSEKLLTRLIFEEVKKGRDAFNTNVIETLAYVLL